MRISPVWRARFSNWAAGGLSLSVSALVGLAFLPLFDWLHARGLRSWPGGAGGVALALLAIDLIYYWHHRLEHRSVWLWPVHAVHHQSPICDTSVSLRLSALTGFFVAATHWPLALVGVPVSVYVAAYVVHTAGVFLLHSQTPKWFDRIGWVFNSPALHRAHHAEDTHLRNANFGGWLVLWDRLFGTWVREVGAPNRFGLREEEPPLNPVAANWRPWAALLRRWRGS
jgi:alkylglycerol monooxygenase